MREFDQSPPTTPQDKVLNFQQPGGKRIRENLFGAEDDAKDSNSLAGADFAQRLEQLLDKSVRLSILRKIYENFPTSFQGALVAHCWPLVFEFFKKLSLHEGIPTILDYFDKYCADNKIARNSEQLVSVHDLFNLYQHHLEVEAVQLEIDLNQLIQEMENFSAQVDLTSGERYARSFLYTVKKAQAFSEALSTNVLSLAYVALFIDEEEKFLKDCEAELIYLCHGPESEIAKIKESILNMVKEQEASVAEEQKPHLQFFVENLKLKANCMLTLVENFSVHLMAQYSVYGDFGLARQTRRNLSLEDAWLLDCGVGISSQVCLPQSSAQKQKILKIETVLRELAQELHVMHHFLMSSTLEEYWEVLFENFGKDLDENLNVLDRENVYLDNEQLISLGDLANVHLKKLEFLKYVLTFSGQFKTEDLIPLIEKIRTLKRLETIANRRYFQQKYAEFSAKALAYNKLDLVQLETAGKKLAKKIKQEWLEVLQFQQFGETYLLFDQEITASSVLVLGQQFGFFSSLARIYEWILKPWQVFVEKYKTPADFDFSPEKINEVISQAENFFNQARTLEKANNKASAFGKGFKLGEKFFQNALELYQEVGKRICDAPIILEGKLEVPNHEGLTRLVMSFLRGDNSFRKIIQEDAVKIVEVIPKIEAFMQLTSASFLEDVRKEKILSTWGERLERIRLLAQCYQKLIQVSNCNISKSNPNFFRKFDKLSRDYGEKTRLLEDRKSQLVLNENSDAVQFQQAIDICDKIEKGFIVFHQRYSDLISDLSTIPVFTEQDLNFFTCYFKLMQINCDKLCFRARVYKQDVLLLWNARMDSDALTNIEANTEGKRERAEKEEAEEPARQKNSKLKLVP